MKRREKRKAYLKCIACGELHEVDEYGWVQTCIGYFDIDDVMVEMEKWLKNAKG